MIIHNCEQGTPEWILLHTGIPSASEFGNLVTGTGALSDSLKDYAYQLAADKFAGKPLDTFSGNRYTDRGTELEPDARRYYEFMTGKKVEQVGFVTDDFKLYGCSPDGLINSDGMSEFKCKIAREHIKTLAYYNKHKRCPPMYVPQTQGQLLVCEREWCDLVFYHPDLPSLIIRQRPIKKVFDALKTQLTAVIAERNLILEMLNKF